LDKELSAGFKIVEKIAKKFAPKRHINKPKTLRNSYRSGNFIIPQFFANNFFGLSFLAISDGIVFNWVF
jgi:hypothetical protein